MEDSYEQKMLVLYTIYKNKTQIEDQNIKRKILYDEKIDYIYYFRVTEFL